MSLEYNVINELINLARYHKNNSLSEYLYREFRKAERDDFFTLGQFFDPIITILKDKREARTNGYNSKRAWIEKRLQKALNNELSPWMTMRYRTAYNEYLTAQKNGYNGTLEGFKAEIEAQYNKEEADALKESLSIINLNDYVPDGIDTSYPYITIALIDKFEAAIIEAKELIRQRDQPAPKYKAEPIKEPENLKKPEDFIDVPETYNEALNKFNQRKDADTKIAQAAFIYNVWEKNWFTDLKKTAPFSPTKMTEKGKAIFKQDLSVQFHAGKRSNLKKRAVILASVFK